MFEQILKQLLILGANQSFFMYIIKSVSSLGYNIYLTFFNLRHVIRNA
jgi:hypothetical protein